MTEKPDAGDIVAQCAVPILPDDTAQEVFDKVTVAAEIALDDVMPALLAGAAPRRPQDLREGSYFRGRKPADGIIDWTRDARTIHNLVRAVAPPYPGAITGVGGVPARILRSHLVDADSPRTLTPTLEIANDRLLARCGGGGTLQILRVELAGAPADAAAVRARFGGSPVLLGEAAV
jgi:methionyl-tRNA formyltransferase